MKKLLIITIFVLTALFPCGVQAAGSTSPTVLLRDAYMPHVDAFTLVSDNQINMPEADTYCNMAVANVTDFVNIRTAPNTDSDIAGRLYSGSVAEMIKYAPEDDSWVEITSGDVTGYIKAQFLLLGQEASEAINTQLAQGQSLTYARSMEDILAEIKAREEEQKCQETSDLRQEIVDFAMQYLGGPYVRGGNSLTKGTDCSGFTSLIYAQFGYSLNRTPAGQLSSDGTKIEYSDILPGDVICYTSNGTSCTHVGLYIGNGQIIHAANSKRGIVINEADYSTILGVKRILD